MLEKTLIGPRKELTSDWSKCKTTKMAGRVERRINDKFYFVLDEVGGSSDCESELASEIDVKPNGNLIEAAALTDGNNATTDNTTVKHSFEDSSEFVNVNSISYEQKILRYDSSSDANTESSDRRDNASSESVINQNKSPEKRNNSFSEEPFAVDMDIDSDSNSVEPISQPLIRVTFRDEAVEKRLKPSLLKLISQKIEDCAVITSSESSLELEVYDKGPKKLLEDNLLDFNLDTTPGDSHSDVPNYGTTHDLVLSDQVLDDKNDSGKVNAGTIATTCFNCLGNHNLRDCTKSKDFRVINKNRLKFQSQKEKTPKTSRYHLDGNQKFSHLLPGVISKKLRNALNLRRDQQPGFIYRMRLLGYPPAWLEEAKVSHSGVAMYDDSGAPVLEEDEEEGEIIPEGAKDKFDITKIIEFPGFNVPLPNNVKDESKYYHCPPLSEDQSKENLIKLLEPKTIQAYVKKSLSSQKLDEKSSSQNSLKRPASPTVQEMEEKKRRLLMELNSEDSVSDSRPVSENSSCCHTPTVAEPSANAKVGAVKNSEFGTPILKSVSSFSKLPSREQFSCNVSDVINFDNLPNATGKYESMREVITKIRTSSSKNQKE